ncbi:hypothetical protein [Thiomicrorhabdus sediminis]|uniref:hypothetical protein n=1 Tax=Thiomicrorhabdus sediminis TaxID=2580412 RepID=UPI00143DB359|nr:hypothetical protein [Thiomicrorhabdus sediminis]
MPDMQSIGSALLITLMFLAISLTVVGLAMWGVYKFFKHNDKQQNGDESTDSQADNDKL